MMKSKLSPFLWGGLVMVLALALALSVAPQGQTYFEEQNFESPDVSVGPIVGYFFGVVVVMAVILFFIPLNMLRLVFRVLFALLFAWGILIVTGFSFPMALSITLAAIFGLAWLLWARVWLHDLLLLVALSGAGAVFGYLFSPLTFIIFMLIIAVYDIVAVRFGFMVWMADRLSDTDSLPAFIFPRQWPGWTLKLRSVRVSDLTTKKSEEREHSILGGGDIGFPLMLAVSVFYQKGLAGGIIIGAFALAGLMSAFLVQLFWLKGKPTPALPPIAFMSLIGFLVVWFVY
jgi:presenilin-like A22 family membrane protease